MSDRDELEALRRLAELEAKAKPAVKPQMLSDPSASLPPGGRFMTGLGTGGTELWQGVKQLFNIGDQEKLLKDIALNRKIDEPFKSGVLGATGNIVAKAAPMVGLGLLPGGATVLGGAGAGLLGGVLEPSLDNNEAARNAMFGAGGGAAGVVAGRLIPSFGKALLDPFRAKGRDEIVGKTLQRFAGDQVDDATKAAAMAGAKTPGWNPTLSEATMNPGLAVLERGAVSADPALSASLATRGIEQNAAALGALQNIAGDPAKMAAAVAAREAATAPLYDQAKQAKVIADPALKSLLQRPDFMKAMDRAKTLAANQGEEFVLGINAPAQVVPSKILNASGQPATTTTIPAQSQEMAGSGLHYLKMALDDMLDEGKRTGLGGQQQRALKGTIKEYGDWLEKAIPPYGQARGQYAAFSQPINEMQVGKALHDKLSPALMDFSPHVPARMRSEQYANAVRNLDDLAKSATDFPGATAANVLSPQSMGTVKGIGEDLARRAITQNMGGGPNSHTAQNLATQNLMRQIFGPLGLPESFSEATIAKTMMGPLNLITKQAAEPELKAVMARALIDPAFAAALMGKSYQPSMLTQQYRRALPTLGATGGLLATKRRPEE